MDRMRELNGRRDVLRGLGSLGALVLLDCGGPGGVDAIRPREGGTPRSDASARMPDAGTCVLDPTLTKGPYWIDERLDRSDITRDSNNLANSKPRPGLPLTLRVTVLAHASAGCSPLQGAQVDIWHTDASGLYSDVQALGTVGHNFLRGYQKTDADGIVTFTTIYPGWYSGRAVHIHVKVRMFDASSNVTTEGTTQVFFDDTVTDGVCLNVSPYSQRGVPNTTNAADAFYLNQTELLVYLRGSVASGYEASITLGVQMGTIQTG
jgi:protocatechuate 3,4-dioxygenase beta subunit